MTDKVQEAMKGLALARKDCETFAPLDSGALLVAQVRFDAARDHLIAAVRADEREKAAERVLLEKVEADVTQHPSDYAYNMAIDDARRAIRNV